MPLSELTEEEVATHVGQLRMVPKGSFAAQPPPPFDAFFVRNGHLYVPRFYGLRAWGAARRDLTAPGEPITCTHFEGELNETQRHAAEAVLSTLRADAPSPRGGLLCLACGMGKTVTSIWIALALGVRTICLCHKAFLLEQWRERILAFAPGCRVGIVKQDRVEVEGVDFVLASIQSVSVREYGNIFAPFGLLIVDECHHVAAPCFSRAIQKIPAAHVLGLSATPERKDGLTPLLHHSLGETMFRAERDRDQSHVRVAQLVYDVPERRRVFEGRDGRPLFAKMLNHIARDDRRTSFAAEELLPLLRKGRHCICLSDRIAQLRDFESVLHQNGVRDAVMYVGTSTAEERERAADARLILSTYCMAREGLDIPRLDTLLMLSPVGDAEQAVGRVLRSHPQKATPLVLDVVDPYSVWANMSRKRCRFYQKNGYTVTAGSGGRPQPQEEAHLLESVMLQV